MPSGLVRLGPEDGSDLVHPLEHADHRLLVELRALREERVAPEVVDAKEVRAALGTARGELTLVISNLPVAESAASADPAAILAVARAAGLGTRTTSELLRAAGVRRREAYRAAASLPSRAPE